MFVYSVAIFFPLLASVTTRLTAKMFYKVSDLLRFWLTEQCMLGHGFLIRSLTG